jgi:SAM-dependent methyltransferase
MIDSNSITIPALRGPVPLSHLFLHNFVRDGQFTVDATCGNGHDTLLLARLVGEGGHVWGFDIQQQALVETGQRVDEAGLSSRVTLLHTGHEELARHVAVPVQVVLFNLGYLPGGDRTIITLPDTTGTALKQALQLLAPGGIVMVTVYPGHSGGSEEQSTVEVWAAGLEPRKYHSWRMGQTNVAPTAPYLLLVQSAP